MRKFLGFVSVVVVTCSATFASNVLVVAQNAGPGVDFTQLQSAIDAAQDGDVVLVKTFTGAGATIAAKSLTLIVDTGDAATLLRTALRAMSRLTPPFSANATASPNAITSTMSNRLTAIFIWQARPFAPM